MNDYVTDIAICGLYSFSADIAAASPDHRSSYTPGCRVLVKLRQIVGDREPRRLGANENMFAWLYRRSIDQRSHGDVSISTVANNGVDQRSAYFAVRVIAIFFTEDHEVVLPRCKDQLLTFDTCERLEC